MDEVTLMVPVGVEHVGSTALNVAVGAPGAAAIAWFNVVSQPAALRTFIVCGPVASPVKPPAGYGA